MMPSLLSQSGAPVSGTPVSGARSRFGVGIAACALLALAAMAVAPTPARADDDPDLLAVGYGIYDQPWIKMPGFFQIDRDTPHDSTNFVTAEFRSGYHLLDFGGILAIKPLAGVITTFKGSVYGYGGLQADFRFGPFFLTPSAAAGVYAHNDGKDMGYPLEFRTQIEGGYRLPNGDRISLAISHISNAELGHDTQIPLTPRFRTVNPGANNLVAYYSFAL